MNVSVVLTSQCTAIHGKIVNRICQGAQSMMYELCTLFLHNKQNSSSFKILDLIIE